MAGIADDLRRIPMSDDLAQTLSRAADYGQAQGHDLVQLEHLLLALAEDPDATSVLAASHVDMSLLFADVSQYLGGLPGTHPQAAGTLAVAPDLKRILEAAAAAASQGRRRDINGAIVLAAIVGDGRSPAAHMLRAQGLTFEEAIKALQRAMAQPAAAPAHSAPPAPAGATEDLLATARARIQIRTAPVPPPADAVPPIAAAPTVAEPSPVAEEPPPPRPSVWPPEIRPASIPAGDYASDPPFGPSLYPESLPGEHFAHAPEAIYEPVLPQAHALDEPYTDSFAPVPLPPYPTLQHEIPLTATLPAAPARLRQPVQQPSSRWPAPVAPAWRDGDLEQPYPPGSLPPPLPIPPDHQPPNLGATWPQEPTRPDAHAGAPSFDGAEPQAWSQPDGYSSGVPELTFAPLSSSDSPNQEPPPAFSAPHRDQPDAVPASRGRRRRKISDTAARIMGEVIPRRMRVNGPALVEAHLPKSDIVAIATGLGGGADPGLPAIVPAMSVRLRAPSGGFVIDAATAETQWIDARSELIESEIASWRWTVTPLSPGWHELQLIISIRAPGADGIAVDQMLPHHIIEVRVRRNFGRLLLIILKWTLVASVGAFLATSGAQLFYPLIAAALKILSAK